MPVRHARRHPSLGTLLRDGVPEALADAGLSSRAISIDGFAATHDWLRGVPVRSPAMSGR